MSENKPKVETLQLPKLKKLILDDVVEYLTENRSEVLQLKIVRYNTKIGGDFFDDFLAERISVYIPIDLKDILNLCLEEPNIVGEIARFTSFEPTTLTIIKEAIRFHLKDYIYGQMQELIKEIVLSAN